MELPEPSCNQGQKHSCETHSPISSTQQMHIPSWLWFSRIQAFNRSTKGDKVSATKKLQGIRGYGADSHQASYSSCRPEQRWQEFGPSKPAAV